MHWRVWLLWKASHRWTTRCVRKSPQQLLALTSLKSFLPAVLLLSFWLDIRLSALRCRSYFAIRWTDLLEMPICLSISRGLLCRPICGLSSWLHNKSWTSVISDAVRTEYGRLLPFYLSVIPVLSTFFSSRLGLVLFHFLFGNSVRSRRELRPFSWRKPFIRQRSSFDISWRLSLTVLSLALKVHSLTSHQVTHHVRLHLVIWSVFDSVLVLVPCSFPIVQP